MAVLGDDIRAAAQADTPSAASVRQATAALFRRYAALLEGAADDAPPPDPLAGADNLRWMCRTALENIDTYPVDKLSRWLGYVQGVLTMRGAVTVNGERNFSRPLFHAAYAAEGTAVPPTRSMGDDR